MNCIHFGKCGACGLYQLSYNEALRLKEERLKALLNPLFSGEIKIFSSPPSNHRARGEFKIWHKRDRAFYAMSNIMKNGVELIERCPKMLEPIEKIWDRFLESINSSEILRKKLFMVEFLSTLKGETLITMIYHRQLESSWIEEAKELEESLNVSIIGRARKQKIIASKEFVNETLRVDRDYLYRYYEGGFTQPNPYINKKMIKWAKEVSKESSGDLLELYCGLGNFTIPLSFNFEKVLATEVSKTSIKNAKINQELNGAFNIEFIRLNASETAQALKRERTFNRLKGVDLDKFDFSTALVDPPRAGLDSDSLKIIKEMDNIIYISCNPITLKRDLEELTKGYKIKEIALFDQFPYTEHIESGVYLERV
jgi:tRNA (uracil-5-)-methyltransferase